jgi:site-specific DNA recombinase
MVQGFIGGGVVIVAAAYARVSTRAQEEGISLDQQDAAMLEYADKQHITVPPEYRFRETASGLRGEREEYDKIRRLIRERRINALIVYATDRHTRDPIHGNIFRAELKRAKAALHVVTKGGQVDIYSAEGGLMATVEDAFNKYWLDKILETTYVKKQAYIHEGVPFVQGSVRYGFRRVGRKREARAELAEEQAEVVRRIYNWADENLSIYKIDKLLMGTPAPGEKWDGKARQLRRRSPGVWGPVAVYRILRDEIYAGTYWANRQESYEGDDGKKRKRDRPREEWVAVPVPAIVSREQWERVQQKLDTAQRERPRMHAKYDYLLARRITCGTCGYAATTAPQPQPDGSTKFYYACSTLFTRALAAERCKARRFRVPETEAAVWAKFKEVITSPQVFLARLRDDQARRREAAQADDGELRDLDELIEEQIAQLRVAVAEYTRYAAKGGILAETFRQQAETLEQTIRTLEQRKAKLEQRQAAKVVSDEEIRTIEELAEWARPRLAQADRDFTIRRQLIEAFNWRFTLVWRGEQRVVVVHWRDWDFDVEVNYASKPSQT